MFRCVGIISKKKGNDNELVYESIPEMSLSKKYINKWNTWNQNELPNQIINGVDSLVKQCYYKQPNKQKQYLLNKYNQLRSNYKTTNSIFRNLNN